MVGRLPRSRLQAGSGEAEERRCPSTLLAGPPLPAGPDLTVPGEPLAPPQLPRVGRCHLGSWETHAEANLSRDVVHKGHPGEVLSRCAALPLARLLPDRTEEVGRAARESDLPEESCATP
jgi:hypothetical protein